jgi:hypothetical protein
MYGSGIFGGGMAQQKNAGFARARRAGVDQTADPRVYQSLSFFIFLSFLSFLSSLNFFREGEVAPEPAEANEKFAAIVRMTGVT